MSMVGYSNSKSLLNTEKWEDFEYIPVKCVILCDMLLMSWTELNELEIYLFSLLLWVELLYSAEHTSAGYIN